MRRLAALLAVAVVVAGCGRGDDAPAPSAGTTGRSGVTDGFRVGAALDASRVAALGDSITAGSPLWDPNPGFRAQIAGTVGKRPDRRSQWEYWYERAHPGVSVNNCGVFGERVAEIEARLTDCVGDAGTVVVQGGINDIAQGAGTDGAVAALRSMVSTLQGQGRDVVLVEVLPWNNGYPDADPEIRALNAQIAALGRQAGVRVLPWYDTLADTGAPGRMAPELTIDGDHPSVAGYRRLAALVPAPAR